MLDRRATVSQAVLLVDDQQSFIDLVRAILGADARLHIVGHANSGEEAMEAIQSLRPDVVVVDVMMPGINGFEAVRRMTATMPGLRAIVVSAVDDPSFPYLAKQVGAAGFISKRAFSAEAVARLLG
jgi:DNA-binding NarL/FixJ family response regulator